jgi:hypothetical protein
MPQSWRALLFIGKGKRGEDDALHDEEFGAQARRSQVNQP